ncbi:MAG: DUF6261 family protein [Odoribacteraceae bacterium]|nr:DUF6261 family protein [Odoribacteraceae bacterium]
MISNLVRLNIRSLSNEVFVRFFTDLFAYIDKFGAGAIGIKQTSDDLRDSFQKVVAALDLVRKSEYTKKLKEMDKFRDKLVKSLTLTVKSRTDDPDPAKKDAALGLEILFDHYWSIPKRAYDKETSAIADLLRELANPVAVARIALLNLTGLVADFKDINDKFVEMAYKRYDEINSRPKVSMREAREEVKEKYDLMLYRLEGVIALNGIDFSEELSGFVSEYNVIATHYKNILAIEKGRRRAAKANSDKEDPNNGEDTPETTPEPLTK